jgi:hypothetical protein
LTGSLPTPVNLQATVIKIALGAVAVIAVVGTIAVLWYKADAAETRAEAAEAQRKIAVDANVTFAKLEQAIKDTAQANQESAERVAKAAKEITDVQATYSKAIRASGADKVPLDKSDRDALGILFPPK